MEAAYGAAKIYRQRIDERTDVEEREGARRKKERERGKHAIGNGKLLETQDIQMIGVIQA